MEFNEKLQQLRKQKGITQEELAQALFVSRTAISKWESGRGYPSIDSLKHLAKFFSVTVDELLSTDEVLAIAEEDGRQKESRFRNLLFGLLDISTAMFLFLPLFGEKSEDFVRAVSLTALSKTAPYMLAAYFAIVLLSMLWGILTLTCHICHAQFPQRVKTIISLVLSAVGTLVFILGTQPYAATFLFFFLLIKVILLAKVR